MFRLSEWHVKDAKHYEVATEGRPLHDRQIDYDPLSNTDISDDNNHINVEVKGIKKNEGGVCMLHIVTH